MDQKRSEAARANGTASGIAKYTSTCKLGYPTFPCLVQDPIDPAVILAARSGVAAATVRACLDAWRIEART